MPVGSPDAGRHPTSWNTKKRTWRDIRRYPATFAPLPALPLSADRALLAGPRVRNSVETGPYAGPPTMNGFTIAVTCSFVKGSSNASVAASSPPNAVPA